MNNFSQLPPELHTLLKADKCLWSNDRRLINWFIYYIYLSISQERKKGEGCVWEVPVRKRKLEALLNVFRLLGAQLNLRIFFFHLLQKNKSFRPSLFLGAVV